VVEAMQRLAQARDALERLLREGLPQLRRVGLELTEKLLGRRPLPAEEPADALDRLVDGALESVPLFPAIVVRLHPEDLEVLRSRQPHLAGRLEAARGLSLQQDAALQRGASRIETPVGTVEARLATQLEPVLQPLLDA
jgi:flagellar assembly protein FliH